MVEGDEPGLVGHLSFGADMEEGKRMHVPGGLGLANLKVWPGLEGYSKGGL